MWYFYLSLVIIFMVISISVVSFDLSRLIFIVVSSSFLHKPLFIVVSYNLFRIELLIMLCAILITRMIGIYHYRLCCHLWAHVGTFLVCTSNRFRR